MKSTQRFSAAEGTNSVDLKLLLQLVAVLIGFTALTSCSSDRVAGTATVTMTPTNPQVSIQSGTGSTSASGTSTGSKNNGGAGTGTGTGSGSSGSGGGHGNGNGSGNGEGKGSGSGAGSGGAGGSGEGSGNGGGGGTCNAGGNGGISNDEMAACKTLVGTDVEVFSVHGDQNTLTVTSDKAVAVKISGDEDVVNLTISGAGAIGGLCGFMAGNQSQLNVTTTTTLKTVAMFETGNQAKASLVFQNGATVSGGFSAALTGNSPSLVVKGGPCPSSVTGSSAGVVCTK